MHYFGESACFWVLSKPYPIFVDKCYYKSLGKAGNASYIEFVDVCIILVWVISDKTPLL